MFERSTVPPHLYVFVAVAICHPGERGRNLSIRDAGRGRLGRPTGFRRVSPAGSGRPRRPWRFGGPPWTGWCGRLLRGLFVLGAFPLPPAAGFTSRRAELAVLLEPELKLGEAYMTGTFVMEEGSIADLLELAMGSDYGHALRWWRPLDALRLAWRWLKQFNLRGRARRIVAHHYDLA